MYISFNKNKKDLKEILLSLKYYIGEVSCAEYLYRKRHKEEMTFDEFVAHLEFLRENECAMCTEEGYWRPTEVGLKRLYKWMGWEWNE